MAEQQIPRVEDDDALISYTELKARFGIPYSRQHLRRLIDAKRFPAPIAIGGTERGRKMWRLGAIRAHNRGAA